MSASASFRPEDVASSDSESASDPEEPESDAGEPVREPAVRPTDEFGIRAQNMLVGVSEEERQRLREALRASSRPLVVRRQQGRVRPGARPGQSCDAALCSSSDSFPELS